MSVRRVPKSPFLWYDFSYKGQRFRGSTECSEKRAAEAFERRERERVKAEFAAAGNTKAAPGMSLDAAVLRYWEEVGKHAAKPDELFGNLERIVDWIGGATPIDQITTDLAASLVARRRGEYRRGDPKLGLVSASTVNRSFTMILRRILTRARTTWEIPLRELRWGDLFLSEPQERVRELSIEEEIRLEAAELPGYTTLRHFAQLTGLRRAAALITWPQVKWDEGFIEIRKKGGALQRLPITRDIRELLWPLWSRRDPDQPAVFLYVAQTTKKEPRTKRKIVAGESYPITYNGWQSAHRWACKRAGIKDFRIHDIRHTAATRTLRGSGDLAAVQKLLGHSDVKTTMKYAHVRSDDLRRAMEAGTDDSERRREDHERREKRHTERHTGGEKPKRRKKSAA